MKLLVSQPFEARKLWPNRFFAFLSYNRTKKDEEDPFKSLFNILCGLNFVAMFGTFNT